MLQSPLIIRISGLFYFTAKPALCAEFKGFNILFYIIK
jgi:hypothetical protein